MYDCDIQFMMTFKVKDIVASDDQIMILMSEKLILRAQKMFDDGSEIRAKQGLMSILKTWPGAKSQEKKPMKWKR